MTIFYSKQSESFFIVAFDITKNVLVHVCSKKIQFVIRVGYQKKSKIKLYKEKVLPDKVIV